MNANQIASLMFRTLKTYLRGDLSYEEFAATVQDAAAMARSAGIGTEAQAAYWQMCQEWFDRQAA